MRILGFMALIFVVGALGYCLSAVIWLFVWHYLVRAIFPGLPEINFFQGLLLSLLTSFIVGPVRFRKD